MGGGHGDELRVRKEEIQIVENRGQEKRRKKQLSQLFFAQ